MAPSGDLHEELNHLMGVRDPKRRVQRLMDSTAKEHGGRHRQDHVHSLDGALVELARKGPVTADDLLAAQAHLVQDKAFDRIWKALPVKGAARKFVKDEGMRTLVRALRAARRR